MKKQFVPYNIALALKEKGYDEGCFGYYDIQSKMLYIADKDEYKISENLPSILCSAPTYQQAINWLFPKLEFNYPMVSIQIFGDGSGEWYSPEDRDDGYIINEKLSVEFDNLNEAIEKVLTLI